MLHVRCSNVPSPTHLDAGSLRVDLCLAASSVLALARARNKEERRFSFRDLEFESGPLAFGWKDWKESKAAPQRYPYCRMVRAIAYGLPLRLSGPGTSCPMFSPFQPLPLTDCLEVNVNGGSPEARGWLILSLGALLMMPCLGRVRRRPEPKKRQSLSLPSGPEAEADQKQRRHGYRLAGSYLWAACASDDTGFAGIHSRRSKVRLLASQYHPRQTTGRLAGRRQDDARTKTTTARERE